MSDIVPSDESRPLSPPPIHPLAALTTIVLDNVFGMIELVPGAVAVTSFVVGGIGFLTTTLIQRHLAKDEWGAAVAKGLVMGVLAGVPYQVTGTAVGVPLLAWAGASKWIRLPPLRERTGERPSREDKGEIVDVDPK
jgi:hypothetical protein